MSFAQRFAKLLWPMLGSCLVMAAVFVSLVSVNLEQYPDPVSNYYTQLDAKELGLQNQVIQSGYSDAKELESCALVAWQNGKLDLADRYLRLLWNDKSAKASTKYDQDFVRDGLYLADLYVDRGSFTAAGETYCRILEYDTKQLGDNDPRVARDYNNVGLCYFLGGENAPDTEMRNQCFKKALAQYKSAEAIFRSHPQCQSQLVYNLQNQATAYNELGEIVNAKALNRAVEMQLNSWHHG